MLKDYHKPLVRKTRTREGQDPELSRRMGAKGVVDSPRDKEGCLFTEGLKDTSQRSGEPWKVCKKGNDV